MQTFKRVLIVDDEPHIARVVGMSLERAGVEVASADDGREALRAVSEEGPFDLVITDYQMPVMDGFAFACALFSEASTRGLPVIMVTARGHKLSPEQLAQTSIRALMAKPFRPRELVETALGLLGVGVEGGAGQGGDAGRTSEAQAA